MSLLPRAPAPSVDKRAVLRVALLSVAAGAVFVVALSVAAFVTQDAAGALPSRRMASSAGDRGGSAEAASVDVSADSELFFVAPEPAMGPAGAAPPPVDAYAVMDATAAVLKACLIEVLPFDPALGGRARVVVWLEPDVQPRLVVHDVGSPVFLGCVRERAVDFLPELAPEEASFVEGRVELDGMRADVTVVDAHWRFERGEAASPAETPP